MFVIKMRKFFIILVLILTILTGTICFTAINRTSSQATVKKYKIVLDAGHGGIDGGVVGKTTGVKESELNLSIVKKLEDYCVNAGFSVVLTRKTQAGLYGLATSNLKRKDMQARKEIILKERPDLVVSVHLNKFSLSSRRGAQVFYREDNEQSKILAQSIQNSFNNMEEAPRQSSPLKGDYYLLNCSNYPSVIAECGFLSNPEDEKLLVTDDYQGKVAYAIFKGIVEYLSQNILGHNH